MSKMQGQRKMICCFCNRPSMIPADDIATGVFNKCPECGLVCYKPSKKSMLNKERKMPHDRASLIQGLMDSIMLNNDVTVFEMTDYLLRLAIGMKKDAGQNGDETEYYLQDQIIIKLIPVWEFEAGMYFSDSDKPTLPRSDFPLVV